MSSGACHRTLPDRNLQTGERESEIHIATPISRPTLNLEPVGGIDQGAIRRDVECAIAGIDVLGTVAQDEEAITLEGEVRHFASGLEAALALEDVDSCDLGAQTNLLGVDAAQGRARCAPRANRLRKQIAEGGPAGFVAGGINVCQVIADSIHEELVVSQTGDGCEKG